MIELDQQFHHAMIGVVDFANPHGFGNRFRMMIEQYGAVQASKHLLSSTEVQEGLMKLWELKALGKSMEAHVIQDKFKPLFNEAEIAEARRRLKELNFFK